MEQGLSTMKTTPLILIAYNRPKYLKQVLDALSKQTLMPEKIIAYVDGAKNGSDENIQECVKLLEEFEPAKIEVKCRPHNFGTARNIMQAITETLSEYPNIVYLEDDTVPSIYFYETMCEALNKYESDKQIFSISGFVGLYPQELKLRDNFDFIIHNHFSCWGFATWRDRWFDILPMYNQGFKSMFNKLINFPEYPMLYQIKFNYYSFTIGYPSPLWFDVFLKIECTLKGYRHIATKSDLIENLDDKSHNYNLNNSVKPVLFPSSTELYPELTQNVAVKKRLNYCRKKFLPFIKITLKTLYLKTLGHITHKNMLINFKLLKDYLRLQVF